jgi:hypothetical protein
MSALSPARESSRLPKELSMQLDKALVANPLSRVCRVINVRSLGCHRLIYTDIDRKHWI